MDKQTYTVAEVAEMTGFSGREVIRLFQHQPGVIVLERPERLPKRRYRSLRIPTRVYQRVLKLC